MVIEEGPTLTEHLHAKRTTGSKAIEERGAAPLSPRVAERSDPRAWGMDELMSLREAVELHWPRGPLSVASLRIAIRDGKLPVCEVARKHLVTRRCLMALSRGERMTASSKAKKVGKDKRLSAGGMSKAEVQAFVQNHASAKKP